MADYKNINIRNKRATFDYEIIEEWIAGIVLVGTEIKSVRLGKASITDSYCYFDKGELWIRGVNIAEYGWGTCNNHVPRRDRKLLLNRKELNKIQRALQDRGLTVVGLRLFLNERGLAKVVVGLARGRKAYDKREYLKENDAKREMDKAMKKYRANLGEHPGADRPAAACCRVESDRTAIRNALQGAVSLRRLFGSEKRFASRGADFGDHSASRSLQGGGDNVGAKVCRRCLD